MVCAHLISGSKSFKFRLNFSFQTSDCIDMAFQFGFANDPGSDDEDSGAANASRTSAKTAAAGASAPIKQHKLEDLVGMHAHSFSVSLKPFSIIPCSWQDAARLNDTCQLTSSQLATLPEHLSYSTVRVESPLGKVVHLPRRELFDVRVQLLQEDTANDQVIDQLDKSDIKAGVYEGGFKTWECSVDLASLLLDRGPRKDIDELVRCDAIIEV